MKKKAGEIKRLPMIAAVASMLATIVAENIEISLFAKGRNLLKG